MSPQQQQKQQKNTVALQIGNAVLMTIVIGFLQWNASTLMKLQNAMERQDEKNNFYVLKHQGYDILLGTLQNKQDDHEGRLIRVEAILPTLQSENKRR